MKKYLSIIFLIVFSMIFVDAKDDNFIIDCKQNEITINNSITCNLRVSDNLSYKSISLEYDSTLNIEFLGNVNKEDRVITFNTNEHDLGNIVVKASNIQIGNYDVVFKNISFVNDDEIIKIDDVTKSFKVIESKVLDSNCNLNGIIVNGVPVKNFDPNKTEYGPIYVSEQAVFIDAIRSSEKSNVMGLGNVRAKVGKEVKRVITVLAENGDKKEYILNLVNRDASEINNEEAPLADIVSSDATIKSLELYHDEKIIEFEFNPKKTVYSLKVDSDINDVVAEITLNDEKASFIDNYGPRKINLDYGDNKIKFKVKAQDNTENVYTLNIAREDLRDGDASLETLKINGNEILISDKLEYSVTVGSNAIKTEVIATSKSKKATIDYQDIDLKVGENNLVITVTAENGNRLEYNVKIIKQEEDLTKKLNSIIIRNYPINFDINKFSYDINISDDEKIDIIVNPDTVSYEIFGNSNLKDGSMIIIKVNEDGIYKDYTINVHKNGTFNIFYVIIPCVILVIIISVCIIIKKKKK